MIVMIQRDIELLGSMPPYYGDRAYTNTIMFFEGCMPENDGLETILYSKFSKNSDNI